MTNDTYWTYLRRAWQVDNGWMRHRVRQCEFSKIRFSLVYHMQIWSREAWRHRNSRLLQLLKNHSNVLIGVVVIIMLLHWLCWFVPRSRNVYCYCQQTYPISSTNLRLIWGKTYLVLPKSWGWFRNTRTAARIQDEGDDDKNKSPIISVINELRISFTDSHNTYLAPHRPPSK